MGEQGGALPLENYLEAAEPITTPRNRVLDRIRKGEDFPATSAKVSLITRLTTASETSISELANIILTDFGLTTKILKLLNSVFYMRFGEVTTISRAIILLGLENLRNIALSLTLFDKLQKKNSDLLINLMAKAVYAGILGRKVANKVGYANSEESFICSLFHNLGEILIAYYSPEDVSQLEKSSLEDRHEGSKSDERALSKTIYQEIGMTIAKEWSLPDMIVYCMKRVHSAEIMTNPGPMDKLHYISAISSRITDIMETTSDNKKTQIKCLIELYGKQFEKLSNAIDAIIPETNKEVIKYCDAYGLDFQKSALGDSLSGHTIKASPPEPESLSLTYDLDAQAAHREESGGEGVMNPETVFADGMKDITNAILDNYSHNDIFRIVIETMFRSMKFSGLEKTLLFIKDTKQPVMNLRLTFGDSMEALRTWFKIPVGNDGDIDIFNLAIEKQRALFIGDTSREDVKRLIPQWFYERLPRPLLLILLPIVVKGRPIGLVYLEGDPEYADSVSAAHLNYLRALHNQIMLAIRQNQ